MRRVVCTMLAFCLVAPAVGGAQTLEGAIDFHAHAAPDGTPRKIDVLELAQPVAHVVDLCRIEQWSALHSMSRSAAAVFGDDERIHNVDASLQVHAEGWHDRLPAIRNGLEERVDRGWTARADPARREPAGVAIPGLRGARSPRGSS